MRRVLIVTPRFIKGGIEKLLLDIFTYGSSDDVQFSLFVYSNELDEEYLDRLNKLGIKFFVCRITGKGLLSRILERVLLYKHLTKHRYDAIHMNHSSLRRCLDLWVAKLAGVKVRIIHVHGNMGLRKRNFAKRIIHTFLQEHILGYCATDYIACSQEAAKGLFPDNVLKKNKYFLLKNGVVIDDYIFNQTDRTKIRNKLGISEDTLVLGNVGRLTYVKNQEYLLEIVDAIKNDLKVCLLIVGSGELYLDLCQLIEKRKINRNVILYQATSEVGPLLSAMDVFLFPSLSEGFGLAALEAQCNGLPIIMGNHLPTEVCINSNVIRLPLNDIGQWIDNICKSGVKRTQDISKIRREYDIEQISQQLLDYYKCIIEDKDGN